MAEAGRKPKRPHASAMLKAFVEAGVPVRAVWLSSGDFALEPVAAANQSSSDSVDAEFDAWEREHGDGRA